MIFRQIEGMFRQNLTLHFNPAPNDAPCLQLDVSRTSKGLHLNLAGPATAASAVDFIDIEIPLERQRFLVVFLIFNEQFRKYFFFFLLKVGIMEQLLE